MVKWWANNEPFSEAEERLLGALYQAHAQCVFRDNCSTVALAQAAAGSRSLTQSYIAALATLGEMHGPIEGAYDRINQWEWAGSLISRHGFDDTFKLPGWGNSFIKGRIDDALLPVDQTLEALFPKLHSRLLEITEALHIHGKKVFPNPACYTAAVALVIGLPKHLAPMLFVQARLEAWASVFHQTMIALNKPKEAKEAA